MWFKDSYILWLHKAVKYCPIPDGNDIYNHGLINTFPVEFTIQKQWEIFLKSKKKIQIVKHEHIPIGKALIDVTKSPAIKGEISWGSECQSRGNIDFLLALIGYHVHTANIINTMFWTLNK